MFAAVCGRRSSEEYLVVTNGTSAGLLRQIDHHSFPGAQNIFRLEIAQNTEKAKFNIQQFETVSDPQIWLKFN